MNDYSPEIIAELFKRSAAVAVAAVLIAGLLSVVRPSSARIHRLLWCLVLLQGWMFLQYQVPIPWYETPPVIETENAVVTSASPVVEINSSPREEETVDLALENDLSTSSSPATLPVAATKNVTQNTNLSKGSVTVTSPATFYWPTVLVGIWITGMLLIVARWFFGYLRFVRSVSTVEVPDDRLSVRWCELLKKHGVKYNIPLRMTESLGPMLCRLPRGYALFLPKPFWNGLSELEQTVVLEHELAHYLRRDVWKSLCVKLLALPHWFNPCAWWAVRRFDQCAEWACDTTAQQLDPEQRISYAKTLMRLVEQSGTAQPCRPALFGSSVLFRVKRLLSPHPPEDTKMKKLVLLSLVLLLIAFSLIRPRLVAQTPRPTVTAKPRFARLPESLATAQANKQPAVPREKLRYDGKSFELWKELLETELKPERRAEAMKAFGAFGANGYSKEAAQAIVNITGGYNFRIRTIPVRNPSADYKLKQEIIRAFGQLISPECMKILIKEIRSGNVNKQWFGIIVLKWPHSNRDSQELRKHFRLAIPALLELTEDRNPEIRQAAIDAIYSIDPKADGFVLRLQQLMSDKAPEVSLQACAYLVELAPKTEDLAKQLLKLGKGNDSQFKTEAQIIILDLGPAAQPILPDLIEMIEGPQGTRGFVADALANIGEDAVTALIEEYKKSDKPRKDLVLSTFRDMGEKAKPALPFLSQEYINETDDNLKTDIINTIPSIISDRYERGRFLIQLNEKMKKAKEDKKKPQN